MGQPTGCLKRAFTSSLQGYRKLPHLDSPARLDFFQNSLFQYADEFGWDLRAWAVLANYYHFVAASPTDARTLGKFLGKLHMKTAGQLNLWDNKPGRKVWFQFWDSHITYERSYLARLNYVHQNPVRHGVVAVAEHYKWCSAKWFSQNASSAFAKSLRSFKIDQVNVPDDFGFGVRRHVAALRARTCPRTPNAQLASTRSRHMQ
jgi:REP-associated tyrosine transposase